MTRPTRENVSNNSQKKSAIFRKPLDMLSWITLNTNLDMLHYKLLPVRIAWMIQNVLEYKSSCPTLVRLTTGHTLLASGHESRRSTRGQGRHTRPQRHVKSFLRRASGCGRWIDHCAGEVDVSCVLRTLNSWCTRWDHALWYHEVFKDILLIKQTLAIARWFLLSLVCLFAMVVLAVLARERWLFLDV